MIAANQPHEDWHFVTIPAENCKGKDMSTVERCDEEAAKALHEAGLNLTDMLMERFATHCASKVTEGRYKTSVYGLVHRGDADELSDACNEEMLARQSEFRWRCPQAGSTSRGARECSVTGQVNALLHGQGVQEGVRGDHQGVPRDQQSAVGARVGLRRGV